MKDNCNAFRPCAVHELETDGMPSIRQKDLGPEPFSACSARLRKIAASRCPGARSARLYAVGKSVSRTPPSSRSKTSASPPRLSAAQGAFRGPIDGRQNVLERRFILIVEHAASERSAIPTAGCQEFKQFAGCQGRAARWIEIAVD